MLRTSGLLQLQMLHTWLSMNLPNAHQFPLSSACPSYYSA